MFSLWFGEKILGLEAWSFDRPKLIVPRLSQPDVPCPLSFIYWLHFSLCCHVTIRYSFICQNLYDFALFDWFLSVRTKKSSSIKTSVLRYRKNKIYLPKSQDWSTYVILENVLKLRVFICIFYSYLILIYHVSVIWNIIITNRI